MLLTSYVFLDSLPLTPSGKVDRRALPQANRTQTGSLASFVAPQSEMERIVAKAWEQVLAVARIGINEDFFDCGGDSLKAVRLCDQINHRSGHSLSLGMVFEHRTVRSQAKLLLHGDGGDTEAGIFHLSRHEETSGAHLFCICGVHIYEPLALAIGSPHRVSGIILPVEQELLTTGSGLPTVEEMAREYADVVRETQPKGPYCLAGLSFGGVLAYELARQLRASGEEVRLLGLFDAMVPNSVSKIDRFIAHASLFMRHGPAYVRARLAARLKRNEIEERFDAIVASPELVDPDMVWEDHIVATMRAGIYDRAAAGRNS
jgi:aryl carrier-like protein